MSRSNEKAAGGSHSVVSPPPSLAANGTRHRSNGNYVKSYGRSSFELQQQQRRAKQPLQPAPQESLRRMNSKPNACCGNSGGSLRQVRSPVVVEEPSHLVASEESEGGVDISPLTSPAQSCVPENRRRGEALAGVAAAGAGAAPLPPPASHAPSSAAASGNQRDVNADKENRDVAVATTGGAAAAVLSLPPPVVVVAAHNRPVVKSSSGATSGTPTVLLRRTPSSNGRSGGGCVMPQRGVQPQKRTTSLKARPAVADPRKVVAAVALSTSPTNASATPARQGRTEPMAPVAEAVEPVEEWRRTPPSEMDWTLRTQLDQADAVLAYVADTVRSLGERRRCGPPPDSTEDFRGSVVPCRRHAAGRCARAEGVDVRNDRLEKDEQVGEESSGGRVGSVALLPDLHRAASGLLSSFTKLEYAQLSDDVDISLLEKETLDCSAQLRRLADGVDRQLSLHEAQEVRQLLADRRGVFVEMHRLADFVARMTQQVVLLRGIAAHHELREAREVWESFKGSVEAQEAEEAEGPASLKTAGAPNMRLFSPLRLLMASPFFAWLESRWFPAMRAWRQLVLEARQLARAGETDAAIRRSRQDALKIAGLQEILRPGESITDLHHAQIVVPVTELGRTFAQKRAAMDELRSVMADTATVTSASLRKALKAAQAYTQVCSGRLSAGSPNEGRGSHDSSHHSYSGGSDEGELIKQAEDLFQRINDVERLRNSVAALLQTPSPELALLLEHITRANELLLLWHLPHDDDAARAAVTVCRTALEHGKGTSRWSHGAIPSSRSSNDAASNHNGVGGDDTAALQPEMPPLNLGILGGHNSSSLPPPPPSPPPQSVQGSRWIGDGFPPGFSVHSLYVPHVATKSTAAWPADFDLLYRELCDVFAVLYRQRQARRQLEIALGQTPEDALHMRLSSNNSNGAAATSEFHTPSPQFTPRRPTYGTDSPPPTQRSSEGGTPTLAAERSSGDGSRRGHTAPLQQQQQHQTSAEELRRRIQQAEEAGITGALVDEARARLRRLMTVRLKIHFDAQTRVLPVTDAAQARFADVYEQLHAHCQAQLAQAASPSGGGGTPSPWAERRLRIRYEDADGDFISLVNQQDWDVMLSELLPQESTDHSTSGGGRIELFCDYPLLLNMSPPTPARQPQNENGGQDSVCGTDYQLKDDESGDPTTAAATTTPEKQPNVFERLTSSKETTPNAHGGRGAGANANRTTHGRPRLGGSAAAAQHALIPRARGGAAAAAANFTRTMSSPGRNRQAAEALKNGVAQRRGANETASPSPGKKGTSTTPAELTADNLRRNIFLASPSPPSTEGRRSDDGDVARSSAGGAAAKDAAATASAQRKPPDTPANGNDKTNDHGDPIHAAAAAAAASVVEEKKQKGSAAVDDRACAVAEESAFQSSVPSSVVHVNMEAARRWDAAGDDNFELLELQTRASVSTVRMDTSISNCTLEMPPSCVMTTTPSTTLSQSVARNTFTTTHCSGRVASAKPCAADDNRSSKATTAPTPPPPQQQQQPSLSSSSISLSSAASPSSTSAATNTDVAALPADEGHKRSSRVAQSPPRHAPRRWSADDFNLDEIETVCSDRSRAALLPVVPRAPTSLPPRPQTPSGAVNRTPQRVRRGARGTPTRVRPDSTNGEDAAAAAASSESANEVFAEMQRMRDANMRAMAQPRKAVWH